MRAVTWQRSGKVSVETVPDPAIQHDRDAVLKITTTAICGSDLHLYNGVVPTMESGDILGHEFMGEVVALGKEVKNLKVGDRVVVPFTIACGSCFFCDRTLWSLCDNTNPNAALLAKMYGHSGSGLFGFSHLYGGYSGGQAQFVRVPMADVGPIKIPAGLADEQVLFLSDIFPTGYMAAENCDIHAGDTVAVWGCGPVGQFAIRSAFLLGAGRVLAIDPVAGRRAKAEEAGAEVFDPNAVVVLDALKEATAGRGPDSCIDAVGMEAHGLTADNLIDRAKMAVGLGSDRPHALREAIMACRKGGVVSIPGVYAGKLDGLPMGAAFAKGLTMRMGQTHMHRYLKPLLERVEKGEIDPSFVITHRLGLEDAPMAYQNFNNRKDEFIKVVMKP